MKKILAALAVSLLLVACGHTVKDGTVVDKRYESPQTIWITTMTCVPVGKTVICTPHLIPYYDDEDWMLIVRDSEDHNEYTIEVSREYYESANIGDHVSQS